MNLRDQLLKAGVVSKKDAQRAEQEKRKQEKIEQGNREAKAALEAKAAAEAERLRLEKEAEVIARRRASRAREEEQMRRVRPLQLLWGNRVRYTPGQQRFYYRAANRRELHRIDLPEWLAEDLRQGRRCIAWLDDGTDRVVIVDAAIADQVEAIRGGLILFRNAPPPDADPSQQLHPGDKVVTSAKFRQLDPLQIKPPPDEFLRRHRKNIDRG